MSKLSAADDAWGIYAEEARRHARIEVDPRASAHQIEHQRAITRQAFGKFWFAFTGKPSSTQAVVNLATLDGRRVR